MQKDVAIGCAVFISAHPVLWMVRLAAHVSNRLKSRIRPVVGRI